MVGRLAEPDYPKDADDATRAAARGPASSASAKTRASSGCGSPTKPSSAPAARSRGAPCGDERRVFTSLAVPVMTRLRMSERQVLDTLVGAGVARSRADALAWCVRLVRDHEGEWIDQLRDALVAVQSSRQRSPEPSSS